MTRPTCERGNPNPLRPNCPRCGELLSNVSTFIGDSPEVWRCKPCTEDPTPAAPPDPAEIMERERKTPAWLYYSCDEKQYVIARHAMIEALEWARSRHNYRRSRGEHISADIDSAIEALRKRGE